MTGSRAACLILALVAILGLAVPNAAVGASCQYAEFPPEPPAGGAVLWSSSSDPTVPNTLVLGLGEQSDVTHCPAPIQTPWVILVAPGGALVFHGHDTEMGTTSLVSPWGAVNVPTPGAAPIRRQSPDMGAVAVLGNHDGCGRGGSADPAEQLRVVP